MTNRTRNKSEGQCEKCRRHTHYLKGNRCPMCPKPTTTPSSVDSHCVLTPAPKRNWNLLDVTTARSMHGKGNSIENIARILGYSGESVAAKLAQYITPKVEQPEIDPMFFCEEW